MISAELDKNLPLKLPSVESLELGGTNITVIGGTGGIGRALSRRLVSKVAQVVVVGQTFRDQNVPGISFVKADLSSIKEAKRVAAELPVESADIVIFTTGIMAGRNERSRQRASSAISR
jgi:nucleoside-diphosphate-sugar epimerase